MDAEALKTIVIAFLGSLAGIIAAVAGFAQYQAKQKTDLAASSATDRDNERRDLAEQRKWFVEMMKNELAGLRAQVEDLIKKNDVMQKENNRLLIENAQLREDIAELKRVLAEVREELDNIKNGLL